MRVVLLRHATRESLGPGDVPLNRIGKSQAEDLVSKVSSSGTLPTPDRLLASPKLRAQQTLTPLAQARGKKLETEPRLDERKNSESRQDFENRIRSLIKELNLLAEKNQIAQKSEVVYLCSHFDWLETALILLDSDLSEFELASGWAPCEFKIFHLQGDGPDKLWSLAGKGSISPRKD